MKVHYLLPAFICLVSMSVCACAQPGGNGDKKKPVTPPTVSADNIPIADPFILYHDGMYYAYGTGSPDGFAVYTSTDLAGWKKHTALALHKDNSYADARFWAPEVYYNSENKTFYLYYSADEHICVATSSSPLGPFKQEVQEPMRAEKSIDSSLFVDTDGTPYLYFVRFTGGNVIWVAELEKDLVTMKESTLKQCIAVSEPWELMQAKVAEGPSVLKKDGVYYMLYSANHYQNQGYGVGYATAASPLGPWTKSADNPILCRPATGLVGTGHGAPFVDADGNLRYVFHAHSSTAAVQPRKMYITDMAVTPAGVTMSKTDIIYPKPVK